MVVSSNTRLSKYHLKRKQKCVLRTLDNLPMKYGYSDSQRLASSCRSVRSGQMDKERLAQRISENQASESRRLFEDVLKNTSDLPKIEGNPMTAWAESNKYVTRIPHTGPLYTQKSSLSAQSSNAIFRKPPRYFKATPVIERTLQRSSSAYRVIPSDYPGSPRYTKSLCDTVSSYPEFILVPNPDDKTAALASPDREKNIEGLVTVKTYHIIKGNHAKRVSSLFPEPETIIDDDLLSSDAIEKVTVSKVKREVSTQNDCTVKRSIVQNNRAGSDKSSKESTRSEAQKQEFINEVPQKTSDEIDVHSNCSKQSLKKTESTTDKQSKTMSKKGVNKRNKNETDLSSSTITEEPSEPVLPDYICPSSEEKSKEARVRHWIRETSFCNAVSVVPLV